MKKQIKDYINKKEALNDILEICKEKYPIGTKFEVGKWYRLGKWISKFAKCDGIKFYGEYINTETKFYDKYSYLYISKNTPELIKDLSEIQQYLPEGHKDKIEQWSPKVDKWYVYIKDSGLFLDGKYMKLNNLYKTFKIDDRKWYLSERDWILIDWKSNFREALPYEIPVENSNKDIKFNKKKVKEQIKLTELEIPKSIKIFKR